MTIELITGTPGAGKTTFAVSQRLVAESKRKVVIDDETCLKLGLDLGTTVTRRLVVAGVRGLKVDHERLPHVLTRDAVSQAEADAWNVMEGEGPKHQRLPGDSARDVPATVQNWWLWCKPGDLIFVDEAQFMAPRGTLGRKPPYWVQALEIHRHYGVDFIFITQHPNLIDPTIRALVGWHRHVRSVMGSPMCMVYVWDHASNPERYTNANKTSFLRRPKHYALFHSSVAHIKPPSSGRSILWVAPLLLCVAAFAANRVMARLRPPSPASASSAPLDASPRSGPGAPGAGGSTQLAIAALQPRRVAGCYAVRGRCSCFDQDAQPLYFSDAQCRLASEGFDGLVRWQRRDPPTQTAYGAAARPAGGDGLPSEPGRPASSPPSGVRL